MTTSPAGKIAGPANKILLIGWDAAEWKILRPLLHGGQMPNLARLIDQGYSGSLQANHPLLSPTLWTTIATGRHPTRHQILGPLEVSPNSEAFVPIGRAACKSEPVWLTLTRAGIPCHAINFPATHPAEHLHGVSVSNFFPINPNTTNSVWPPNAREPLAALRITPREIDAASLLSFVPRANEIDPKRDPRLKNIAMILAHTATVHAAATWALQNVPWRFAAICYTGLHQFSHGFMPYHPPQLPGITDQDFNLYQNVITAAYRFHDLMLGRLLELAGPDTQILLVSDHGFQTGQLRPTSPITTDRDMLAWHRPQGIAVMCGPAPKIDSHIQPNIFDIAPTILGLFGLAPPPDMRGRALHGIAKPAIAASHPASPQEPEPESFNDTNASVEYLHELGYTESPDIRAQFNAQSIARKHQYYLAIAWLDAREPKHALPLLEDLVRQKPTDIEYRIALAHAYAGARRITDCRRLVDEFLKQYPDSPLALAAAGMLEIFARQAQSALTHLRKAEQMGLRSPALFTDIGRAYLRLRMFDDAGRSFERAIALDDEFAAAHSGLARCHLAEVDPRSAADSSRRAISLRPDEAGYHYQLARALLQLAQYSEAKTALERAIAIDSGFSPALRKLADVCEKLGDLAAAKTYDRRAHLAAARHRITAFERSGKAPPPPE